MMMMAFEAISLRATAIYKTEQPPKQQKRKKETNKNGTAELLLGTMESS